MIGRLLCAMGFHKAPKERRWLWFCRRPGCPYLHAADVVKKRPLR